MKPPSDVMSVLLNSKFLSKQQGTDFAGFQPLIFTDQKDPKSHGFFATHQVIQNKQNRTKWKT